MFSLFAATGSSRPLSGFWQFDMEIFSKLPDELQYLAEPADKYGRYQFGADIDEFLESASESDIETLTRIAERYELNQHDVEFQAFLDRYPITDHKQSAQLYFLFLVIDAAGIVVDAPERDPVVSYIESLKRFGSVRLASRRMLAAQFLADYGADANPAIPLLQRARMDEDPRVRVWANCTLFRIAGNQKEFVDEILTYLRDADSDVRTEAASALGKIGQPASIAIPNLIAMIENRDEDEYDIGIYMESLVAIGGASPIVIETLLNASKSDIETIREDAEEILAELKTDA